MKKNCYSLHLNDYSNGYNDLERILAMSDEEILAEYRANGGNPEQYAVSMRGVVRKILEDLNRGNVSTNKPTT